MHKETVIYGYVRVSTAAQDESSLVRQQKAAGCGRIFREKNIGITAAASLNAPRGRASA
jgi:hypothetical protein